VKKWLESGILAFKILELDFLIISATIFDKKKKDDKNGQHVGCSSC
jgi:hypothetical protein